MSNGWTSPGGDSPDGEQGPGQPPPPQYGQNAPEQSYGGQAPPPYGQQQPQYGQYAPPQQPQYGQYAPPQQPQYGGGPPPYAVPPQFQLAPKPGVIPLRPLNLGDIFSGTFATIRGNPGATLGLSALIALIVAIPSVLVTLALSGADLTVTDASGQTTNFGGQIGIIVGSVFSGIAGVLLAGMLTAVVSEAVLGRRISIGDTWRKVRGRLLPLIGLMLLLGLAAVITVAVVVGIIALLAATTGPALAVIVGILLGIGVTVLIIWVALKVSLGAPALVLERVGPITAVRRSWGLTAHQWWRILGITLLANLIVYMISQVISTPVTLVALATSGTDSLSTGAAITVQLVAVVVSALTTPFTAGVTALLYLDQRIRKEALDVTIMAAAAKDGAGAR